MSSDEEEPHIPCDSTSNKAGFISTGANRSGRPKSHKTIKFSPQHKSLIILLLREAEEKRLRINKDIDDPLLTNSPLTQEDQIETTETTKPPEKCSKRFSCDYPDCTYSCKLSCNLIKHKRKHTSEKPYICHKCTFRTNYINSLKVHQRLHGNERPFQCKQCSYKCNSSSNIKKHCLHRHNVDPAKTQVDNDSK